MAVAVYNIMIDINNIHALDSCFTLFALFLQQLFRRYCYTVWIIRLQNLLPVISIRAHAVSQYSHLLFASLLA